MKKDTREKPGATCFNRQGTADAIRISKVNPGSRRTRFSKISRGSVKDVQQLEGCVWIASGLNPKIQRLPRAQMWLEGDAAAGWVLRWCLLPEARRRGPEGFRAPG